MFALPVSVLLLEICAFKRYKRFLVSVSYIFRYKQKNKQKTRMQNKRNIGCKVKCSLFTRILP